MLKHTKSVASFPIAEDVTQNLFFGNEEIGFSTKVELTHTSQIKCHQKGSKGITVEEGVESANGERSSATKLNHTVPNAQD